MAITNPGIEDGFDLDSNNLLALGTLVDDGYATNEIPKSGNINTVFKDLYRYMQHLKDTGISQWDNTTSYEKYSRTMRDGILYSSLSDANSGNDPLTNVGTFWKIDEWRKQTSIHNITVDSDYTLTADQNNNGRVVITDTGVVLTVARNIIVDDNQKDFIAQNDTLQDITFKTNAGTGIIVSAGTFLQLYNNGTNVIAIDIVKFDINGEALIKVDGSTIKNQCTAWVTFDGSLTPPVIDDSFNIASVTRGATGQYTISFDVNMNNENYCVNATSNGSISNVSVADSKSVSTFRVDQRDDSLVYTNSGLVMVLIFGGKN